MEKATRFHRRRLPPALAELREEPDHVFPPPRKAKEEEDEQATFDREAREGYKRIKAVIMRKIMEGTPASAAEYLERDIHLWRLADADILKEYNWYTTVYLGEDTPPPVRGMAEMIVIKLGEVVKKPQQIRIKLMERRIEEEKAAKEAREHDAAKHASEPELRDKQNRMNQAAFEECRARWLPLLAEMEKGALSTELNDEERALARRVSYRAELKLVVTSLDELGCLAGSLG
ncbi:hypothetical protein Ctob_001287 [Chrysochromulina tobinii]|uniref:Uncharacterized protein n=1 Tax=Chrysochromulina tobinii TaxID=1460289 RepID=A0A0M0J5S2_9EUKA|nr:hypothetical protein Ctob_001287 [Chrysochromulina tobinii]|eukprot:KOO21687.1 hypothetical protein Ctob_001287 [Chrysochromulina sp. CCMP291]